jgi:hypothetical protein
MHYLIEMSGFNEKAQFGTFRLRFEKRVLDLNIIYVQLVVHHRVRPWSFHGFSQENRSSYRSSRINLQYGRWLAHHKSAASYLRLHLSLQVDQRYLKKRRPCWLRSRTVLCTSNSQQRLRHSGHSFSLAERSNQNWRRFERVLLIYEIAYLWGSRTLPK